MTDLYSELADALGSDEMDSHAGRLERARRMAKHWEARHDAPVAASNAQLRGQLNVLADLLAAASLVIVTIDAESDDEADRVSTLLDDIAAAVRAVRMPGVDIDAIHRRPDTCAP